MLQHTYDKDTRTDEIPTRFPKQPETEAPLANHHLDVLGKTVTSCGECEERETRAASNPVWLLTR